jgi:putative glycosyltransferase (TIGR04348 family)
MRVVLVCPAPPGSRLGNRVTALRWKRLLGELGHHASITTALPPARCDVVIALHARHSASAVRFVAEHRPNQAIVVAMTGTDLYRDILSDASAQRSVELADVLVVLHDLGARALPRAQRNKVQVVRQSADAPPPSRKALAAVRRTARADGGSFDVAIVAHLRSEKDPLRAALATRHLRPTSRIRVLHAGRALTEELRVAANEEQDRNPRYRWLGEISPLAARRLIARSHLMVLTSVMEGGANVLGEAIVCGTPIVASRIPASVAALGPRYPGLFPVGDTAALARLLARAEREPAFLARLTKETRARRTLFTPSEEKAALRAVLRDAVSARRRVAGPPGLPRANR